VSLKYLQMQANYSKLFSIFCRNAVEMMSATGGELGVAVRVSNDRRNVEIEIRDTGPGIEQGKLMGMLFRPFFHYKETWDRPRAQYIYAHP